jgi:hypothetical protein
VRLRISKSAAPVEGDSSAFWLVQRMSRNDHPRASAVGLDRAFRLDYMGSSEFEGRDAYLSLRHHP